MKVFRQISTPIVKSLINFLDSAIPEIIIRTFLEENMQISINNILKFPGNWEEIALSRVLSAYDLGSTIGIVYPKIKFSPNFLETNPTENEISAWIKLLPKGRVVSIRGIYRGTGNVLAYLAQNDNGYAQFASENFERLLRHVEVKRKKSLSLITPRDVDLAWQEKHAVSIALSRYSRSQKDYRFLNAALKLNDWAFPSHKNLAPSPRLAHYLAALTEAEYTLSLIS